MKKKDISILLSVLMFFTLNLRAAAQTKVEEDWQMKSYFMVLLTAGPNRTQDSATASILMKGHLDNIGRLFDDKKLVLAGPFLDNGTYRGIFILDVPSAEAAAELLMTDPAIKAGRLDYEMHPWYGPANIILKPKLD
jgi:uncharacterized protein